MKIYAIILLLLSILLGGCQKASVDNKDNSVSSNHTAEIKKDEVQPIKVVESAYSVVDLYGETHLRWAVVIENPNTNQSGFFPRINITAFDETNSVVGTEEQVLPEIPPGTKLAFATTKKLTKAPKNVEFSVSKVQWKPTASTPADYVPFGINKLKVSPDGKDKVAVNADIKNPYPKEVPQIAITALFRDESGKLTGGLTTYVEALPANGIRPLTMAHVPTVGEPAKTELMIMPWGTKTWNDIVDKK